MAARFAGRPLWVLADPDRDAFLGDDDIEIVADAKRNSGALGVGWTAAATPAFLTALPRQIGFSWDGWLLLDGERDHRTLATIADVWRDSRVDLDKRCSTGSMLPVRRRNGNRVGSTIVARRSGTSSKTHIRARDRTPIND